MTTARRLALRFGVMALLALSLEGGVSIFLSFGSLQDDAARDAVALGQLAAGLVRPELERGDGAAATARLVELQSSQETARFGWRWVDAAEHRAPEPTTSMRRTTRGAHVLALVPVVLAGRTALIQVDDDVSLQANHVLRVAGAVLALILLLAGAFLVVGDRVGARLVGRPVQRLIDLTRSVGKGDLAARTTVEGNDELSQLAAALNQMVGALDLETRARLDAADRLRHADRLVTVGRLSAGIAHELGTPLNIVLLRAQLISALHDEATEKHANLIQSQVGNMERIVKQLLGFARKNASTPGEVNVAGTIESVRELLEPAAQARSVRIAAQTPDRPVARVDRQSLEQVLSILVMNALQAMAAGGLVTVSCRQLTGAQFPQDAPRRWCRVDVIDSGPGLPREVRDKLFEPFVTTKPIGSGTGLGLSVAWGLVHEWGGWFEVAPPEEPGCRFSFFLPLG